MRHTSYCSISLLHQIGEKHRITDYNQEASTSHGPSIDLRCHPLQCVCSPFEVEGELIAEVVVEMVRAVVVHLSQLCLLRYPPILTPHLPYPHTLTHHVSYPHTLTHNISYPQTLTHLYHIRCYQSQTQRP